MYLCFALLHIGICIYIDILWKQNYAPSRNDIVELWRKMICSPTMFSECVVCPLSEVHFVGFEHWSLVNVTETRNSLLFVCFWGSRVAFLTTERAPIPLQIHRIADHLFYALYAQLGCTELGLFTNMSSLGKWKSGVFYFESLIRLEMEKVTVREVISWAGNGVWVL